jgi:hypothetical protein
LVPTSTFLPQFRPQTIGGVGYLIEGDKIGAASPPIATALYFLTHVGVDFTAGTTAGLSLASASRGIFDRGSRINATLAGMTGAHFRTANDKKLIRSTFTFMP